MNSSLNIMVLEDSKQVVVQTLIQGEPKAWISFNYEEFDNLVKNMQDVQSKLKLLPTLTLNS
jgi:hypothetical protein